ncbi:hypothetical protein SCUCBS95973_007224 [Sporothrix curviconia]|uniref:Uncharacterized protein n=1 Tax=Sporothrix curviconia TaxID=1260050 RepID=A0ABP0CEB8_9PEZI
MKAFKLKPTGTGSTSKSHASDASRSQSLTSTTSTSLSSASSAVSSSFAHAKHAASAAWSACKQGTRTTLQRGSWTLHRGQQQHKAAQARRFFRLGRGQKSHYHSLDEDYCHNTYNYNNNYNNDGDDDDDGMDIFSGRPFRSRLDAGTSHTPGHRCDVHCDSHSNSDLANGPLAARFVLTPQHAASSYLATATARHMYFAADEGESDDDEWWRD